jgi:hypothetical protein
MAYAYFDKGEVLHVVDSMETAIAYTNGTVVETDHLHNGGYPVIETESGVEEVVYEDGQAFIHGNINGGKRISTPPSIQEIIDKLKA